ncbi:MAG: flavodoxin family protein [Candidatus Zipacnadales bacterium]
MKPVKILAIQTSPNEDGLTANMAQAALKGAAGVGAETELIHLRKRDIKACLACEQGWGLCRKENRCIIEDEFQSLREQMGIADGLIISTPVYFGEISEVAKSFLDRLRRCEFTLGEDSPIHGTPAIGISAAGGSGGGVVTALEMLERYLRVIGIFPFDLLTVTRWSRDHKLDTAEAAGRRLIEFLQSEA